MIRVLSAHAGADTGGIGWALARAFERVPPVEQVELRSAIRADNYIAYPHDLSWEEAEARAEAADVVHLHNTFRTARILNAETKPAVIHHHGTHYRQHSGMLNMQARRRHARAVVSTLDLLDYGRGLTWVPHPYDLERLAALRAQYARPVGPRIRVGHAPTDRAIKSTRAFLLACEELKALVEPVLIEGTTWARCLARKASVDVYFDQVTLGYGCNAIEAWGMGIPVIAGAARSTLDRMRSTFGKIPFLEASPSVASIAGSIEAMATNARFREIEAEVGLDHVRRWHDGRETVARLTPIYAELAS